jgi:hypothetical protein
MLNKLEMFSTYKQYVCDPEKKIYYISAQGHNIYVDKPLADDKIYYIYAPSGKERYDWYDWARRNKFQSQLWITSPYAYCPNCRNTDVTSLDDEQYDCLGYCERCCANGTNTLPIRWNTDKLGVMVSSNFNNLHPSLRRQRKAFNIRKAQWRAFVKCLSEYSIYHYKIIPFLVGPHFDIDWKTLS